MSSNSPDSRVKPRALLPASYAFVVQFGRDTDPRVDRFVGQVEHLASARQKRFASRAELLVFIDETLDEARAQPDFWLGRV